MSNAVHPDRMTAAERLDEVASILALGMMRLRGKVNKRSAFGDIFLDLGGGRSVHGREPTTMESDHDTQCDGPGGRPPGQAHG